MAIKDELQRAFGVAAHVVAERRIIRATVGIANTDGTFTLQETTRPHRVWVTTDRGTVLEVANLGVPLVAGTPVLVDLMNGDLTAISIDHARAVASMGESFPLQTVGPHTHRRGFGLDDFVEENRFEPGLLYAGDDLEVRVFAFWYAPDGYWGNTTTLDLASSQPASGSHRWVRIGFDTSDDSLEANNGTAIPATIPLNITDIANISLSSADIIPIGAVKLNGDQTTWHGSEDFVSARTLLSINAASAAGVDYDDVLFVGKYGSDSNDGKRPEKALLTIGAALTAASALTPATDNRILIEVLDAGVYDETITVPSYVIVNAPAAELTTADGVCLTVGDSAVAVFNRIINTYTGAGGITSASCISKVGGSTLSWVYAKDLTPGEGGIGVLNTGTGSQLFSRIERLRLSADDSFGVIAAGTGAGHIHIHIGDIYLNGDNTTGLWAAGGAGFGGTIVGHVEHVLNGGGATGTTAILMNGSTTDLRIDVSIDEIGNAVSTALNIDFGTLTLTCQRMIGDVDIASGASAYLTVAQHVSGSVTNAGTLGGRIGNDFYPPLTLVDDAALAPLNVTERSAAPTSPAEHDVYLDDGTNTASGDPGWRRYNGAAWEDVSAGAGAGGSPTLTVVNNSGGAAAAKDVGLLQASSDGLEYVTTTTEAAAGLWCVVAEGGADGDPITVYRRGSGIIAKYAGSAPSKGDKLVTSTTAGKGVAYSYSHYNMFAVCTAAGAGGEVEVTLLTNTIAIPIVASDNLLELQSHSGTSFAATAGSVSGTTLPYSSVTGSVASILPRNTPHLAHLVVHCPALGEKAYIESVDSGAAEITVTDGADIVGWDGYGIQVNSTTNTDTGSGGDHFYDLYIATEDLPDLTRRVRLTNQFKDTGAASQAEVYHPWETGSQPARISFYGQVANVLMQQPVTVPITDRTFTILFTASGAGTKRELLRLIGAEVAAP